MEDAHAAHGTATLDHVEALCVAGAQACGCPRCWGQARVHMMVIVRVDGTLTIRCRCWSVGVSVGWQRHTQLKGIDNLGNVQRSKAVSCSEAPSNTSNSSVLSDSLNFLLVTGLIAGLRECEWKRFSPAALSKEIPSSAVAGGLAGFIARLW